jgi:hypothetical protein
MLYELLGVALIVIGIISAFARGRSIVGPTSGDRSSGPFDNRAR